MCFQTPSDWSMRKPLCQEWAWHPPPDQRPPLQRPTWHKQRVCALHVESFPPESSPLCSIDISVYKMRNPPEVSIPSWEGPSSTSSIRQRTSSPKDRCSRPPERSPGIPRSRLWGFCLATRRSPEPCGFEPSRPLLLFFQEWKAVHTGPCENFGLFSGMILRVSTSFARCTWLMYIQFLVRLCPRRGIEWSHAATTFCLVACTVSPNDSAHFAQPCPFMSLVSSRYSRSLSCLSRLVFYEGFRLLPLLPVFTGYKYAELDVLVFAQGSHL